MISSSMIIKNSLAIRIQILQHLQILPPGHITDTSVESMLLFSYRSSISPPE